MNATATATAARAKMTNLVDSQDLDQITSHLHELNKMDYIAEVRITTHAMVSSVERRFPELAAKAWEIIEVIEDGKPEVFMDFSEALLLARAALDI